MSENPLRKLPLDEIIRGCQQQKPGYCLELLRRAFDLNNHSAMTAVYEQYKKLVFDWVHKSSASCPYPLDQEDVEDIAIKAITKFFKHLACVDVKSSYEDIAQALGYCRRCVKTTVIDFVRQKAREAQMLERLIEHLSVAAFSKPSLTELIERQEQGEKIQEILQRHLSKQEFIYLELKFVYGLKPREFPQHFPELFPDVETVYKVWDRTKRKLKNLFQIYIDDLL